MKRLVLLFLIISSVNLAFSWSTYGADNINSFSSNFPGQGALIDRFSYTSSGVYNTAALITDNLIITASDKVTALDKNGVLLWTYSSGIVKGSPLIYEDSVIFAANKLTALYLNSSIKWEVDTNVLTTPTLINNILFASLDSEAMAYYADNGSLLWNITLPGCSSKGVTYNNNLIISCALSLYSIDYLTGQIVQNTLLSEAPYSQLILKDNVILFSSGRFVYAFDTSLNQLDRIRFFGTSKAVRTNTALSEDLFVCAENGLYSVNYDSELYFTNMLSVYAGCKTPIIFDYDNSGASEVMLQKGLNFYIINSTGYSLISRTFSSGYLSASDLDSDSMIEVAALSGSGQLIVYDTSYPDNTVSLFLNGSGLVAVIENKGFEDSINATLSIISGAEVVSEIINVQSKSSASKVYSLSPLSSGAYTYNASIFDLKDLNGSNNNAGIIIESVNVTGANYYQIIKDNTFYDFKKTHSALIISGDINNDGVNEVLINSSGKGFDYFREGSSFYPVGDLRLSVNHFYDEIYEGQVINVYGAAHNDAIYPIKGVRVSLFVDEQLINESVFDLSALSNSSFNFNISGLKTGEGVVSVFVDKMNKIIESDESNNVKSKGVRVFPAPVHNLSVIIDTTTTSLSSKSFKIKTLNSGDFDETLIVSSNPALFSAQNITSKKETIQEFKIDLNAVIGSYSFNLTIKNKDYFFSENLNINLVCTISSECSEDLECIRGECVEQKVVTEEAVKEENVIVSKEAEALQPKGITGFVTGLDSESADPLLYTLIIGFLIIIASISVYFVSFKLFENHAHLIAITNIILFVCIAYLFKPANLHIILIEEIILSMFAFSITKKL